MSNESSMPTPSDRALFSGESVRKPKVKAAVTTRLRLWVIMYSISGKQLPCPTPTQKPVDTCIIRRFCDDLGIKKVSEFRPRWAGKRQFKVRYFNTKDARLETLDWPGYASKLVNPQVAGVMEV